MEAGRLGNHDLMILIHFFETVTKKLILNISICPFCMYTGVFIYVGAIFLAVLGCWQGNAICTLGTQYNQRFGSKSKSEEMP